MFNTIRQRVSEPTGPAHRIWNPLWRWLEVAMDTARGVFETGDLWDACVMEGLFRNAHLNPLLQLESLDV
jgi:hypothetical protein